MPTTSNGTAYTVTTATVPTAGTVNIGIPDSKIGDPDLTFILYAHGAGGAADQFSALAAWKPFRDALIDTGIGWAESTGGGTQPWGNPASEMAYAATMDYADSLHDISNWIFLGRSMGAAVMARLYNAVRDTDPRVVGLIVNSGVQDLVWAYDWDSNRWTSAFNSAWGVSSKSQFEAAVDGLNPVDGPASAWDGANVLQLWGTADDTVPAGPNGDAMRTLYSGRPAYDPDPIIGIGKDHSASNGMYSYAEDMMYFVGVATGEIPATPVPKEFYRVIRKTILLEDGRHLVRPRV